MNAIYLVSHPILPIICALLCYIFRQQNLGRFIGLCMSAFLVFGSISLCNDLYYTGQEISYYMGGLTPPYGIELKLDPLGGLILLTLDLVLFFALLYDNESSKNSTTLYPLMIICYSGLVGAVVSNDLFNIYVFLEISSLASYSIISSNRKLSSLKSSFNYLMIGTIGISFYLLGVGFIYLISGTLNITEAAQIITQSQLSNCAFVFIFIGLAVKSATLPVHAWLPGVYSSSSRVVSIFLSGTSINVSIYLILRFFSFFHNVGIGPLFTNILLFTFTISMLFGGLYAFFQKDIKRLLAYSSISQTSYVVIGFVLWSNSSVTGAMIHFVAHTLGKITLFANSSRPISTISKIATVISSLSLIGVPITLGFVGKWTLMQSTLELKQFLLFFSICCSSIFSFLYSWKIIERCQHQRSEGKILSSDYANLTMIAFVMFLIIYPKPLTLFAIAIASSIIN